MTTEEKFNAAVNVIRSLPKNGSYQPSNELMLRFYAFFKQATQGPCTGARPAFWDVVGRAKYDAWKKLGDMSKQVAMDKYVHELHCIVETMSYNDNVANFLEAQTELERVPFGDLELIAGDVIERVRSQPNSPFASREASPQRLRSSLETSPGSSPSVSPPPIINNTHGDSDHSDEEYIDTLDSEPEHHYPAASSSSKKATISNGHISENIPNGHISRERERQTRSKNKIINHSMENGGGGRASTIDISHDVQKTIQSLKDDIQRLNDKVHSIEKYGQVAKRNKLISFHNVSPAFLAFIVLWPFVSYRLLNYWNNRK